MNVSWLLLIGLGTFITLAYGLNLDLLREPYPQLIIFSLATLGSKSACYYSVVEKDRPFFSAMMMNLFSLTTATFAFLTSQQEFRMPDVNRLTILGLLALFGYWQFYIFWKGTNSYLNKQTWMFVENGAECFRDLSLYLFTNDDFIKKWASVRILIQSLKFCLIIWQQNNLKLPLLINLTSLQLLMSRFCLARADMAYSSLGSVSDIFLDQILLSSFTLVCISTHYLIENESREFRSLFSELKEITWKEWVSASSIGIFKSLERLAASRVKKMNFFIWLGCNRFIHCVMESLFQTFNVDTFRWDYVIDGCSYLVSGILISAQETLRYQVDIRDAMLTVFIYLTLLLTTNILSLTSSTSSMKKYVSYLFRLMFWFS